MLEQRVRDLLYGDKEALAGEFELGTSSAEDKDIQVETTLESTTNSQLLHTNTSSIATAVLQDKIDRLEREKMALLNSQPLRPLAQYTQSGISDDKENPSILQRTDKGKQSEINEIREFSIHQN